MKNISISDQSTAVNSIIPVWHSSSDGSGARISDVQLCFWQDEAFTREPGEGGRREAPTYKNDGSRFVVPDAIR